MRKFCCLSIIKTTSGSQFGEFFAENDNKNFAKRWADSNEINICGYFVNLKIIGIKLNKQINWQNTGKQTKILANKPNSVTNIYEKIDKPPVQRDSINFEI